MGGGEVGFPLMLLHGDIQLSFILSSLIPFYFNLFKITSSNKTP